VGAGLGGKLAAAVGDAAPFFALAVVLVLTLAGTQLWRRSRLGSRTLVTGAKP
jgi:hypothetical protein